VAAGPSRLLKNAVFRQLAWRHRLYRQIRWLQAIENVSPSKTTFSKGEVEKAMDGFFNSRLVSLCSERFSSDCRDQVSSSDTMNSLS
jgi:hypothetical protein